MKVSGFTIARNVVLYDYPIVESITSILPLCDEVVVAVGNSEDETLALIQSIPSDKIKIIQTVWDNNLREGGKVLAVETNKAFNAIARNSDWAFYIQGDEVLHEKFIPAIKEAMEQQLKNEKVDGLLFHYNHFYGSYDYIGSSSKWYPHEIRIIRNNRNIYSYRDAQGFRKDDDTKLNVKIINASIYHYGWVKEPKAMQEKQKTFQKLWHNDEEAARRTGHQEQYEYEKNVQELFFFKGTHPRVMQERVKRLNWKFDYNPEQYIVSNKEHLKRFLKKYLGIDSSYRNYKLLD